MGQSSVRSFVVVMHLSAGLFIWGACGQDAADTDPDSDVTNAEENDAAANPQVDPDADPMLDAEPDAEPSVDPEPETPPEPDSPPPEPEATPPEVDPEPEAMPEPGPAEPDPQPDAEPEPLPASGVLTVLSYNVAGLPLGLSSSDPAENTPLISPMLNSFDLVLVQEDFGYHDELAADAQHPHVSTPMETGLGSSIGDGLNRFSASAFADHTRQPWESCNGYFGAANDCLTSKGFSFARHTLPGGAEIDVYNLHCDAGRDDADIEARAAQVDQLLAFMATTSEGRALIVAGDTNMKDDDEEVFQSLLDGGELIDACRALECPEPMRIDRVLFRSSADVTLSVEAWEVDESFVDDAGEPLSDHEAVAVELGWST